MRLTQGTFSYLRDLTEAEIAAQVRYCLENGWAVAVEHTDDPHPRHVYWEMWGLPMFDQLDPAAVLTSIADCRAAFPHHYVRVNGYDRSYGRQTVALSFLVQRPSEEPGFRVVREEGPGRTQRYTLLPYATERPPAQRHPHGPAAAANVTYTGNGRHHVAFDAEPAD